MNLEDKVIEFIEKPFPLWETDLTNNLRLNKWKQLTQVGIVDEDAYATEKIWLTNPALKPNEKIVLLKNNGERLYLEKSSIHLKSFYDEHGLELLDDRELETGLVIAKLKKAFTILQLIKPAYDCVTNLVHTIQVLRNNDPEIDLSYSHPKIPFSIFVSVCDDDSQISNLRVAESILHEAMHLKLTLIEEIVPLVKTNANYEYYSPWKDEERPVQGVLHGLFVFRAIYEFYKVLNERLKPNDIQNFFVTRLKDIRLEILSIKDFQKNIYLTKEGKVIISTLFSIF